jgi:hypothetical protein
MLNIEKFAIELSSNPNVMKNIEQEVERLSQTVNCNELYELKESKNMAVHIFLCKILEKRIKRKFFNLDLSEEIQLCTSLLASNPSHQVCEVYSLLGLYCWPTKMPEFINNVTSLLGCKTGYQILLSFLENVNTSTSIDEKRRIELKKALSIISDLFISKFQVQYASFIIPIYTEFLKILPKNFNFSLVFEYAKDFPDEAISFFVEGIQFIEPNKIIEILEFLPCDQALIQILTNIKITKMENPEKVFEYVFKCLSLDQTCFKQAIEFWVKIFSNKNYHLMVEYILTEVVKKYISIDEELKEEIEQNIFGFFTVVSKNYPENVAAFIQKNGDSLPQKLTANFIQKLQKVENSKAILNLLSFSNNYLNCLVSFLKEDPNYPNLIFTLNFNDKDNVKLALSIMENHEFSKDQLVFILKMCETSCLNANEIKVLCCLKLGIHETFGTEWSMNNVVKYFYYLKKAPVEYTQYKDYYYSLFIANAPFDRAFSIVEKIGSVPPFILESIYEKMDKYPFIDLCCFNNDLLGSLDNPVPFIQKEVNRFVAEWNTITEHKDYYQAVKSLLTIFVSKANTFQIADYLVDLIQIDSSIILNKVLTTFNSCTGPFNVSKAVYYLISVYNLPNVSDSHPLIALSLTECMYKDDGPSAFHNVLGIDINRCVEIRNQIKKVNKRTAQNMVRDLIKDFKGKPFNKMFEEELKVTKQNFLPPKNKKDGDYTLKNVQFI